MKPIRLTVPSAAALAGMLLPAFARADFPQKSCGQDWSPAVPVDVGAFEFDKDLSQPNFGGNYGLNEYFYWPMYVSSNVLWMNPHLLNWDTESGYDYLRLNNDPQFTGSLGTQWYGTSYGALRDPSNTFYQFEWRSDTSITRAGYPKFDSMRFQCPPAAQQTSVAPIAPINLDTRYDGVFFNDQDILYFSVNQIFLTGPIVISLDVNAGDAYTDLDLYASTTTARPDDSNFTWRGYHSGGAIEAAGETLVIPKFTGFSRTIWIGVRNYSGHGHFSLRASAVKTDRTLTICTQDMTPAQLMADPGWPNMQETIQRTLLRVFQATNGNMWTDNVKIKLQAGGLQSGWTAASAFCPSDASCDLCMDAYGTSALGADGCGFQGLKATGRMRIPNVRCQGAGRDPQYQSSGNYWDTPEWFSRTLLHESGHALGRMVSHQDVGMMLDEEYANGHAQTAHSVMNGPEGPIHTSTRFSTTFNYCPYGDPQTAPSCPPSSDWTRISTSGVTGFSIWTVPDQTKSSPPWLRAQANINARSLITFTAN
jgi:hypothetical protein